MAPVGTLGGLMLHRHIWMLKVMNTMKVSTLYFEKWLYRRLVADNITLECDCAFTNKWAPELHRSRVCPSPL